MTRVWESRGLAMAAMRRDVWANDRRSLWQTSQSAHWWSASRNSQVPESRRAKRVVRGCAGTRPSAMGRSSSVGSCSRDRQNWPGGDGAGAAGPLAGFGDAIRGRRASLEARLGIQGTGCAPLGLGCRAGTAATACYRCSARYKSNAGGESWCRARRWSRISAPRKDAVIHSMAWLAGVPPEGRGRLRPIGAILRRLRSADGVGNFRSRRQVLLRSRADSTLSLP